MQIRIACLVFLALVALPFGDAFEKTPTGMQNGGKYPNLDSLTITKTAQNARLAREKREADEEGEQKSWTTRTKEWFSRTMHRMLGSATGERAAGDTDDVEQGSGVFGRFLRWLLSLFADSQKSVDAGEKGDASDEDRRGNAGKPIGSEEKRRGESPEGGNNAASAGNAGKAGTAEELETANSQEVSDWENGK